ncbi:MAG: glycosyltransferase family 4 protein [Bacteroides thetaiotaomicron]|nr:glycosyltransferase family 4 protein [Bacteroides thetaiotaomicron]
MADKKKKHILMVSQYFYPEQFRINDMCVEWVKRGYKVTVLTGIPNYPQGEYYEGYDLKHKRTEEWNGVKIVRIPLAPRGHNSVGMVTNYMSFVASGFAWKAMTKMKADLVFIFEVSPMTQALVGVWYAKKHKVPCYLYVQDLWPENVEIVTGIHSPAVIKPIGKMVDYIYENCTRIFATSPSFVKEIQKRCRDKSKVSYWPQYAEEFYKPVDKEEAMKGIPEIAVDGCFNVVFTGNIGQAQGLEILPKAAAKLKGKKIKFVIVGDGRNREEFESQVQKCGVDDMFVLIGRQPAERIPDILACCDVAFLSFMDNELFAKTIPAKLQSYMACGMPIVASATGETKRIIEEAGCGICCDIGDADGLAEAIAEMAEEKLDEMGKCSEEYYRKNFCKEELMDYMDGVFGE